MSEVEEKNKDLVHRFLEARVMGDVDAVEKMLAPTSSTTLKCFPMKSPAAKASSKRSLNTILLSPTPVYSSRTR